MAEFWDQFRQDFDRLLRWRRDVRRRPRHSHHARNAALFGDGGDHPFWLLARANGLGVGRDTRETSLDPLERWQDVTV